MEQKRIAAVVHFVLIQQLGQLADRKADLRDEPRAARIGPGGDRIGRVPGEAAVAEMPSTRERLHECLRIVGIRRVIVG
ncbi:hypothetical protein D3C84_909730 [compost metagenome]